MSYTDILAQAWGVISSALESSPTWQTLMGNASVAGIFGGLLGFVIGNRRFTMRLAVSAYNDLDNLYRDIIAQRLNNPALIDQTVLEFDAEDKDRALRELEVRRLLHAYSVWTFLESIRDRLGGAGHAGYQRVWQPIFICEGREFLDELGAYWCTSGAFQNEYICFLRDGAFIGIYRRKSWRGFLTLGLWPTNGFFADLVDREGLKRGWLHVQDADQEEFSRKFAREARERLPAPDDGVTKEKWKQKLKSEGKLLPTDIYRRSD